MALWQTILQRVDYLTGRFDAFFVETGADLAACMRILEEVRWQELHRVTSGSPLEVFAKDDIHSLWLACRDTRTGEIVGCVRATRADQLASDPKSAAEYRLDLFDRDLLPRAGIATRLAFRKELRQSAGAFVLLEKMYSAGVERGYLFCLLSCEPGLYHTYARLGFRPIGRVHPSPTGGFRVPMVMVNHDAGHLREIRSPLHRALSKAKGPLPDEGVRWIRSLLATHGPIDTGIARFSDPRSDVHRALTEGLSSQSISALLTHAMTVDCIRGQSIVEQGDGGGFMGFVTQGRVEVIRGNKLVGVLGAGDVFGEIAVVLNCPRTARLLAASDDTRVLLLSRHAIDRVKSPRDQKRLWQNISRALARKLATVSEVRSL